MGIKAWVEEFDNKKKVRSRIKKKFTLSKKDPDFVFVYGGDGTLLLAERKFPGIPKIFIRKERKMACGFCPYYFLDNLNTILKRLPKKQFRIFEAPKIEVLSKRKKLIGMNEVQIHVKKPIHSLRFSLSIGTKKFREIRGDGLIVATPFGSSAYFSSIGGTPFRKGLKIGFNNTSPRAQPVPLLKSATVKILREEAWLIADNNPEMLTLKPGDSVVIRESDSKARFVEVNI